MYKLKETDVYLSEMAVYLNCEYKGRDILIRTISDIVDIKPSSLFLIQTENFDLNELPHNLESAAAIVNEELENEKLSYIISPSPIRDFYRLINEFFIRPVDYEIHKSAILSNEAEIGINVNIGAFSNIGKAKIGNNVFIGERVTISDNVEIENNAVIKSGAVIGSERFEFVEDEEMKVHMPQFGKIRICESAWIGSNVSIERPFLNETIISSEVKIDDLVHIGSATRIGKGVEIASGTVIGRNVDILPKTMIGINTSIKPNIKIGSNVVIGMGSVVIKDVEDNVKVAGVPAKQLD